MFREQVQGSYKDTVKWFAGVADNVVHVTLSDMENDNVFYDHMIHVHGQEQKGTKREEVLHFLEERLP